MYGDSPPQVGGENDLVRDVCRLSAQRALKYFHSDSCTHIFFQPCVGPVGVRGTGTFPDEAYENFMSILQVETQRLTKDELLSIQSELLSKPSKIEKVREIQISVNEYETSSLIKYFNSTDLKQSLKSIIVHVLRDRSESAR